MPALEQLQPLNLEKEVKPEPKYKFRVEYDIPEEQIPFVKEALKSCYYRIYAPLYKSYDFQARRLKENSELNREKQHINDDLQLYRISAEDNTIKASRYGYKIRPNVDSTKMIITLRVIKYESSTYSYISSFDGKQGYYYNERTKRKLSSNQQFNTWCNASVFIIEDSLLQDGRVKQSSFDKFVDLARKRSGHDYMSNTITTLVKYFEYRTKYPEIDSLIQKELSFSFDLIYRGLNLYNYFFEGRSFKKNFILPKACHEHVFKAFRNNHDGFNEMGILNQLQFHTKCIDEELIQVILKMNKGQTNHYNRTSFLNNLKEVVVTHQIDIKQALAYLERADTYQAIKPADALEIWKDYLSSAKQLRLDKFDKYPSSLKREHDVFARDLVAKRDEIEEQSFEEAMAPYQDITYEDDEFCVVVPKVAEDLKREGRELSHCVGTYVGKVAQGRSKIFFIRKKDEVDKALYTLEVVNNRMAQYRGKHNCSPTSEAVEFANKFILEELIGLQKGEVAGLAM